MDIQIFEGNFFEIGRKQGEIYRKRGMNFDFVKIDSTLYKNQLLVYKKYYPELLEEFSGMAEGGEFEKEKLIYHFITSEIKAFRDWFDPQKACTIFGIKSGDTLFVGRNYDWLPEAEKLFELYKTINPQRNSFLALTDGGYGGEAGTKIENLFYNVDDAINDKGLFIGITFAHADSWSYGISYTHMAKIIAETCSTVDETLKVFEKTPLCCPKNFFIADKNGDMAIIEHTSKKFKIVYPKDNILIKTNHYLNEDLKNEDVVLKRLPIHNTYIRYHETFQRIHLNSENMGLGNIIEILGNPKTYTCQNFPGIKTLWTLALDMTNKEYKLYWDIFEERKEMLLEI